jgi:lipopolysaccharide heptosyltransferase I
MSSLRTRRFDRILIVKTSAVGDIVHALPLLSKLRTRYPAARIDWLVRPENADLVRHHPALSGVVLFDRRRFARFGRNWAATAGLFEMIRGIRQARYDLVLDLHGQLRSALICLASGARARVGYAWSREGARLAYTHRVPVPTLDVHAVDRYLNLCEVLGLDHSPPDFTLHLPLEVDVRVSALLASIGVGSQPLALLVPGTIWETKHWRPEGFAEVGRALAARGFRIAVAGAPSEAALCRSVAEQCPGSFDLAGRTTIGEFVALVRRSAVCVTNDSASMHLAVALDRPVVSAFGPTSPLRTGPYRRMDAAVVAPVDCSPCYLRKLAQCPHDHACMDAITPSMMLDRIEQMLAASKAA